MVHWIRSHLSKDVCSRATALGASVLLATALLTSVTSGDAAAGATSTDPGSEPSASVAVPPTPVFGRCEDPTLRAYHAECAFVTVPKDYSDPSAGTIQLAVSRVLHTTSTSQGIMLVNPGGPGGSGLIYSILGGFVPHGAGNSYDWIGFDPRGVGASRPSVMCDRSLLGYHRPDYVATSTVLEDIWLGRSSDYSQACAANTDLTLLRNMTTADNAKDMESIRLALGEAQINYYGFSYGTYLGQVYATLFPDHLRRAVFDSNVDPTRVWYNANLDQDKAFGTTSEAFFDWVARHDDVYHLGNTAYAVSAFYYGTLDKLRRKPEGGGKIGPAEWNDAIVPAGYYQVTWLDVAAAMAAAAHGNWTPMVDAYGGTSVGKDNGFGVYLATECTDAVWPHSYEGVWKPDALSYDRRYPFLTWNNVWFNAPCLTWPAPGKQPVAVNGSKVAPVLLIGEELDAATPFSGSLRVRQLFPRSALVGSPGGTSHAVSLFGVACVDNTIARYLATGALPERQPGRQPDKTCRPAPEPDPSAAAPGLTANGQQPPVGAPAVAWRMPRIG